MWPDRLSNPGPLTYESGALPTALRGPASQYFKFFNFTACQHRNCIQGAVFLGGVMAQKRP